MNNIVEFDEIEHLKIHVYKLIIIFNNLLNFFFD